MTLPDLISRLEKCSGPDRELADEVLLNCGWSMGEVGNNLCDPAIEWLSPDGSEAFYDGDQPNPLASVDAAMGLIPEGFSWFIEEIKVEGHDVWAKVAEVVKNRERKFGLTTSEIESGLRLIGWGFDGRAKTPAIALTIAAIKARAENV